MLRGVEGNCWGHSKPKVPRYVDLARRNRTSAIAPPGCRITPSKTYQTYFESTLKK